MELGDRLRYAREQAELTQVQVKAKTGINNKTISNYEQKVSSPDPATLKTLADLYGVTIDWLIRGSDHTYPQTISKEGQRFFEHNTAYYPSQCSSPSDLRIILSQNNVYYRNLLLTAQDKQHLLHTLDYIYSQAKTDKK
ncbi:MAG: hypothetical protein H6Q67_1248 [Firmicutes bacterium]|nr:hypothetical protein [Bacillota bacterium]